MGTHLLRLSCFRIPGHAALEAMIHLKEQWTTKSRTRPVTGLVTKVPADRFDPKRGVFKDLTGATAPELAQDGFKRAVAMCEIRRRLKHNGFAGGSNILSAKPCSKPKQSKHKTVLEALYLLKLNKYARAKKRPTSFEIDLFVRRTLAIEIACCKPIEKIGTPRRKCRPNQKTLERAVPRLKST